MPLTPLPELGTLPSAGLLCLASIWGYFPCLIVSCLLCLVVDSWLFSEGKWRGVDWGELKKLGRVEDGKTVVRMYCMREESIFNF